jgi:hypothetical protein
MTASASTPGTLVASETKLTPTAAQELTAAALALFTELEASLEAGQKALLARDVASLDCATDEQMRLRRALGILLFPARGQAQKDTIAPELQAAACRVLHLTRVQDALLRRAQRFLSVLCQWASGPNASYGELVSSRCVATQTASGQEGEPPCRV